MYTYALKFNAHHDERGRFATADNASTSVDNAAARQQSLDKIMAKLKPEQRAQLDAMNEANRAFGQTIEKPGIYVGKHPNGEYTEERKKFHDAIVDKYTNLLKNYVSGRPELVVLGGRGGSGKSKFTPDKNGYQEVKEFDASKFLTLDGDEIKKEFEPLGYNGRNAAGFHEEASDVLNRIVERAAQMRASVLIDGTLKSKNMEPVIKGFHDLGYNIQGHYMQLSRVKAAERAIDRALGPTGRYVPPEVVLANFANESNFNHFKKYFNSWTMYSNDVPKGTRPKLLSRS